MIVPAFIEVLDWKPADTVNGLLPLIPVQFNPTEYTLEKGAQHAEIAVPGIDSPILQFVRGQNEKLTLDLFFDTTDIAGTDVVALDVRTFTYPLYQLVKLQPRTHAPPRIRFIWGTLIFKAVLESVRQQYTLFNPLGLPVRATLTCSFREYKTLEDQLGGLNLMSSDHTKRRVVRRGDTLAGIAYEEYGDAARWRTIADENTSVAPDPRRLEPGTVLSIPPTAVPLPPTLKQAA